MPTGRVGPQLFCEHARWHGAEVVREVEQHELRRHLHCGGDLGNYGFVHKAEVRPNFSTLIDFSVYTNNQNFGILLSSSKIKVLALEEDALIEHENV